MEKMIFRTLTAKDDIDLVLEKIERYSGVRLPLDYVSRGKVVGVFLKGQLVANYMLVTKPSFRSLMFVPDSVRNSAELLNCDQYEMMEVNGLWIGPALKTPSMQLKVWMHLIKDIFFSRKKYVLLMRDSRNRSMERFLNMVNPVNIYTGPPLTMAGQDTHENIQVSYTTRWSIVFNIHKYLLELRSRKLRSDQFSKGRLYIREMPNSEAEFV